MPSAFGRFPVYIRLSVRMITVARLTCCAALSLTLVGAGCSGNLTEFVAQNLGHVGGSTFRASVIVSPSQTVAAPARQRVTSIAVSKRAGDACTLYGHVMRSQPGYSARSLAQEFAACVLRHGAAEVSVDFEIGDLAAASDGVAVEIPVDYRVSAVIDTAPASTASWVAEAAWQAIPREGSFTIRVPARSQTGLRWEFARLRSPRAEPAASEWRSLEQVFSPQEIRTLAMAEASVALAARIEPQVRQLVAEDGLSRFQNRKAAYGVGLCALEVAPQEDGIDSLAVLYAAQQLRDGKYLPAHLAGAQAEERDEVIGLARKVCGVMTPKTWKSTQREQLDARPVFISKSTVVLELPRRSQRLGVSRNAFTAEGEELLTRMEALMGELVAKLNQSAVRAAGVDPAEVEARWRKIMPNVNEF